MGASFNLQNDDELSSLEKLVRKYGWSFLASMSFCGFLCLSTTYVKLIFGTQRISKLTMSVYICGMHFLIFQTIEMVLVEQYIYKVWELAEAGSEFGENYGENIFILRFLEAVQYLKLAAFLTFLVWESH